MPVSAILLDLYGTLIDLEIDEQNPGLWRAIAALFDRWDRPADPNELEAQFLSLCAEQAQRYGYGSILPSVFTRLLSTAGKQPTHEEMLEFAGIFRRTSTWLLRLKPYTRDLLSILQDQGMRLALVSNTESILSDFDVDTLDIRSCFQSIVFSSDFRTAKPDPEIFAVALRRLHVSATEAIMVGDSWDTDIAGARAAGLVGAVFLEDRNNSTVAVKDGRFLVVRAKPDLEAILAAMRVLGVAV